MRTLTSGHLLTSIDEAPSAAGPGKVDAELMGITCHSTAFPVSNGLFRRAFAGETRPPVVALDRSAAVAVHWKEYPKTSIPTRSSDLPVLFAVGANAHAIYHWRS